MLEDDGQPSDLKGDGCSDLFSEECNQSVTISVSEEIFMEIKDQKYEKRVETGHVESDCFPLCFPSFQWLKKRLKVFNQILPHIIQLPNFCYKKRSPLPNQKIPFLNCNLLKVTILV